MEGAAASAEDQARALIGSRQELRAKNAEPTRLGFAQLRDMKADLKKSTILAKKFRTYSADQEKAILAELVVLNMSKFAKEAAQGVVAAIFESKMKVGDAASLTIVCSAMHQMYEDFLPEVMSGIKKSFSLGPLVEEMEAKMDPSQPPVDVGRLRVAIRTMCEFWVAGLLPNANFIVGILIKICSVLDQGPKNSVTPHFTINSLNVVSLIVKTVGIEVMGPASGTNGLVAVNGFEAAKYQTSDDKMVPADESVVAQLEAITAARRADAQRIRYASDVERNEFSRRSLILVDKGVDMCGKLKKGVETRWRAMCEQAEIRGDPTAEQREAFNLLKREADKFYVLTENIAAMCGRAGDMPPPIDLNVALQQSCADQNVVFTSALADFYSVKVAENVNYFDDDEQRSFYEELPTVDHLLPTAEVTSSAKLSADDDATAEPISGAQAIPESEKKQLDYTLIEALMAKLRQCAAKSYIDQWTEEFLTEAGRLYNDPQYSRQQAQSYFMNCRKMLQAELRFAPSNAAEMLPFLARGAAILAQQFTEMGELLATKLDGEVMLAVRNKTPQSYMRKMRNTRYLCELVKFRLTPPIRVIRLFNLCLDELDHPHNTEMVCILLENVTSFLMRGGMTRVKAEELLDKLTTARKKLVLATEQDTMLDHSLSQVRQALQPRRQATITGRIRTPLEQYARHLLFGTMNEDNFLSVRDKLRKMPYNDTLEGDMLTLLMRKCHKIAYDKVNLLAEVVADTCDVHGWVGINIIDSIVEDLRLDLEFGKFREMQRRLQDYKYLGELYNFKLVTFPLLCFVFGMLVLYFPRPDLPNDYSRIRCVCAILQTSARYFLRKATVGERQCLRKLLAYFYLHVHSRTKPLPLDLDHRLCEVFTTLSRQLGKKRHGKEKVEFPQTRAEAEGNLQRVLDEKVAAEEEWFQPMLVAFRSQENMRIYPVLRTVMPVGFDTANSLGQSTCGPLESSSPRDDDDDDDSDSDSDSSSSSDDDDDDTPNIVTPTMGPLANAYNVIGRRNQQSEEDKEFDALFRDVMKEASAENVKRIQHKSAQNLERNVEVKMSVSLTPLVKSAQATSAAARTMLHRIAAGKAASPQSEEGSSGQGSDAAQPAPPASGDVEQAFVKIAVLRRNQEKIEARGIFIPSDSEFAQRSSAIVQQHQLEMEEQKLRTLQFQRQHEAEAEAERRAAAALSGGRRGRGGRW